MAELVPCTDQWPQHTILSWWWRFSVPFLLKLAVICATDLDANAVSAIAPQINAASVNRETFSLPATGVQAPKLPVGFGYPHHSRQQSPPQQHEWQQDIMQEGLLLTKLVIHVLRMRTKPNTKMPWSRKRWFHIPLNSLSSVVQLEQLTVPEIWNAYSALAAGRSCGFGRDTNSCVLHLLGRTRRGGVRTVRSSMLV